MSKAWSEVMTRGVVIERNGLYWGLVHERAYGWGSLANAEIRDARYCKKPTDVLSDSDNYQRRELSEARLVPIVEKITRTAE